jgi:hypothetical protein
MMANVAMNSHFVDPDSAVLGLLVVNTVVVAEEELEDETGVVEDNPRGLEKNRGAAPAQLGWRHVTCWSLESWAQAMTIGPVETGMTEAKRA